MSEENKRTSEETNELGSEALEQVSGGFNPQPEPPASDGLQQKVRGRVQLGSRVGR
jgi:hypothetical protein